MALADSDIRQIDRIRAHQRRLVIGTGWAAVLILLLAWWVGVKHWDVGGMPIAVIMAITGVVALAAALREFAVLLQIPSRGEQAGETLKQHRAQLGLGAFAISAVLLILVTWLLLQQRLAAFPEFLTGLVLVIAGIVSGLTLRTSPERRFEPEKLLDWCISHRRIVSVALLVLGGAAFIGGVIALARGPAAFALSLPVGLGGVLLGLIFGGSGLWLLLTSEDDLDRFSMRILVLSVGGAIGFVVAVMTLLAVVATWDAVIGTGVSQWQQADKAWPLWLAIYVELLGLILMFGSLYLAQGDIRRSAVLRRLLYGYNAVFNGLLLLAALVILNILVYSTFPFVYEWTKTQGFYSLSEQSKEILSKLEEPVTFIVLMGASEEGYRDVVNLLANFQAYSPKIKVKKVSPDLDPREYERLKTKYRKLEESAHGGASRGLLIVYGQEKDNPAHAFIGSRDLLDYSTDKDESGKIRSVREFKAEGQIMTELKFLALRGKKPVVYFTQSNEEIDFSPSQLRVRANTGGRLRAHLEKLRYEVRQLYFRPPADAEKGDKNKYFTQKDIKAPHQLPKESNATVVIAWPKRPFPEDVLTALHEYMKSGGKLVILAINVDEFQKKIETNLEAFAKKYGVEMERDVILRARERASPIVPVVADPSGNNELARGFADEEFYFDSPRTVRPGSSAEGYRAETVLVVPPLPQFIYWADKNLDAVRNPQFRFITLLRNPDTFRKYLFRENRPVAVAVKDRDGKPRMVVYGAAVWATDMPVVPLGRPSPPYQALFASTLEWLGERPEFIGIPPRTSKFYMIKSDASVERMTFVPLSVMLLGFIGLGLGVWAVRRR